MDFMYRTDIELNTETIIADGKYTVEYVAKTIKDIYLNRGYAEYGLEKENWLSFVDNNVNGAFYLMGFLNHKLYDIAWFKRYVKSFIWIDKENGYENADDMYIEIPLSRSRIKG